MQSVKAKRAIPTEVTYDDGAVVEFDLALARDAAAFRAVMQNQVSLLNMEVAESRKKLSTLTEQLNKERMTVTILTWTIAILSMLTIIFFLGVIRSF